VSATGGIDPGGIDPGKSWRGTHGIPVVPVFDGYRAAAILGVVLFHVFFVSGVFLALGDSFGGTIAWGVLSHAVVVLFIVSGFVVYLPTVARGGDFGRVSSFAIRRAARILPAYWLVLVVALVLVAIVGAAGTFPNGGEIAAHIGVVQTPALLFANDFSLGFGVVPPVWTLSVEMAYYLLLPFFAVAYFRRPFVGLALAAGVVVLWHVLGTHSEGVADLLGVDLSTAAEGRIDTYYASQLPAWIFAFALGMTGAWTYVRLRDRYEPRVLERRALFLTALTTLALALIAYRAGSDSVADPDRLSALFAHESVVLAIVYPAALATVMIGLALSPRPIQLPFSNALVRWTGDISYGIYLIHFAVIWLALEELSLSQDGSLGALGVWAAVTYPLSLGYGYLSARFLERPVRRWAHRFGGRAQAAAASGSATAPQSSASTTSLR
jgi:peptidoglycan/LPS O-acetylase OafA/YrhL